MLGVEAQRDVVDAALSCWPPLGAANHICGTESATAHGHDPTHARDGTDNLRYGDNALVRHILDRADRVIRLKRVALQFVADDHRSFDEQRAASP